MIELDGVLGDAIERHRVPGASVAVLHDGEVTEAAAGVLNVRTGVEVTPDSLFQIGSITKPYTATMVMQLVESGQVELDAPVRRYVPDFRVADPIATDTITIRHLLTHTSGFDGGDHFYDGGRGDDTLARYVESLAALGQVTAPGAHYSYNNAAFSVLGRLIELVTGELYDVALRERLLRPAGLDHSVTLPEDVLLFRAAAGHHPGADRAPTLVGAWGLSRSAGPAGAICASAADVVGFARLHLDNGRDLLSSDSVASMQQPQVTPPGPASWCGLAWHGRALPDGTPTVGHNGGTVGQLAFLNVLPAHGTAIAVLTNGAMGAAVWKDVATHVTTTLGLPTLDATLVSPPSTPVPIDVERYLGTFDRTSIRHLVHLDGDLLTVDTEYIDIGLDLIAPPPFAIFAIDEERFVVLNRKLQTVNEVAFLEPDDDGVPQLLFAGGRLARRCD